MKKLITGLVFALATMSFQSLAQDITVSKSVELSAADAVDKVFHVQIPDNGVVVLAVKGNDRFSKIVESSNDVTYEIDGKTAFVKFNRKGQYSVGASTVCGIAFSIVVDVYSKTQPEKISESLPKVVINSNSKCIL